MITLLIGIVIVILVLAFIGAVQQDYEERTKNINK